MRNGAGTRVPEMREVDGYLARTSNTLLQRWRYRRSRMEARTILVV